VDVNLEISVNNINVNVPAEPALEAQSLCSDKDLRAVDVVEWLLYSARAAVFSPFQAAKEPEPAEEAAQAEAARAAAEEAAQAAEAARAQVLDHRPSRVQKLRSRRSTFNFHRHVVPPAAFNHVKDVTRGRDRERARVTWEEWQRSITEAHEPPPAVATAAPELNPAASEGSLATSLEVGELTTSEAPENAPPVPVPVPVDVNLEISVNNINVNVPAEPAIEAQSQSVLVPKLPDLTSAAAAQNVIPALELRYAIGSSVCVKRSNGEEMVACVKEYDAEKALYTVELGRLGSRKAKTCSDKDLRAVDMVEWLLYSARATVFPPFLAAQEPEPAEEAAQAEAAQAEAARAAAEEAAQAAEAARAQVLDHRPSRVQKLRSRRSTFNFHRHVVPPAAFPNVRDVTRGRDSERARVTWEEWQRSMEV
jgi:nucleotide-binding universal stress UspA family protein